MPRLLIILSVLTLALPAAADTLYLKDGSIRQGTIAQRSDTEIQLLSESDGFRAIFTIPTAQVTRITPSPPASQSHLAESAPVAVPILPAPPTPAALRPLNPPLARSIAGLPGNPSLPAVAKELWSRAMKSTPPGSPSSPPANPAETLQSLRALETLMHLIPDGESRLEMASLHDRHESFGLFLAQTHLASLQQTHRSAPLDLQDIRDIERQPLLGLLKEQTIAALDPLRPYFPPINFKTGLPESFRPQQLDGITLANALQVKSDAQFATNMLLTQIKLNPHMPSLDRQILLYQLANVNRALSRASDLEPAAKMALERAETQRKAAEELARRQAAIQKQKKAATPHPSDIGH